MQPRRSAFKEWDNVKVACNPGPGISLSIFLARHELMISSHNLTYSSISNITGIHSCNHFELITTCTPMRPDAG
jgi:hypothetical protein